MKIAIVGSRNFVNYSYLLKCLIPFNFDADGNEIVSGGAKGADSLAKAFVEDSNLKFTVFPADWDKNGKSAGFIRNKKIVEYSDIVVAFWDGVSSGTRDTIEQARKLKKTTLIFYF